VFLNIASLISAYVFFELSKFLAVMVTDSETTQSYAMAKIVFSIGVAYLIATVISVAISQWKRSAAWATWPIWGVLGLVVLSFGFTFWPITLILIGALVYRRVRGASSRPGAMTT
jgi:uncharacterized membrane protein